MKTYGVKIPFAGHVYIEVKAADEESAIEAAMSGKIGVEHIEEWDTLRQFNKGNVSYCPRPWSVEAEVIDDG